MLRLRPYKNCDAKEIVTWCKDEAAFRKWSSNRFKAFPITADDMNAKYNDCNGDCIEADNFYPMTAFDDSGVVGHLIMRFIDEEKTVLPGIRSNSIEREINVLLYYLQMGLMYLDKINNVHRMFGLHNSSIRQIHST